MIEELWIDHQEFLDIPGIHLPDDTVTPLRFEEKEGRCITVPIAATRLRDFDPDQLLETEDGVILCSMTLDDVLVQAGECIGHGSRGFIAAIKPSNKTRLLWIAFFEWSNPFVELTHRARTVLAQSSLGATWSIELDAPTNISVTVDSYGRSPCSVD